MAMHRTIFEIPVELQEESLRTLDNYELSYFCCKKHGASFTEVSVTYSSSQKYLIEMIEQRINKLASGSLQAV